MWKWKDMEEGDRNLDEGLSGKIICKKRFGRIARGKKQPYIKMTRRYIQFFY